MKNESIVLYHTDTLLPNHLFDCIKKIKNISNIPIYLLTDQKCELSDVIVVNIKKYEDLNWLNDLNYFIDDTFKFLWRSSCFRFFYLKKFLEETNLNNILHFDNDVLLYECPEIILEKMCRVKKDYLITAHNDKEVVMGMSYIKDANSLKQITDFIKDELLKGFQYLQFKYGNWPNEMQLVSNCGAYNTIPVLPPEIASKRYSNYFDIFNSVFDPSSYGQYLGGTFQEKQPGWFEIKQEIGKNISNKSISVFYENKNPYLIYKNEKIKINNLHIHSKLTTKFL